MGSMAIASESHILHHYHYERGTTRHNCRLEGITTTQRLNARQAYVRYRQEQRGTGSTTLFLRSDFGAADQQRNFGQRPAWNFPLPR